jgi:flagellar motor switch protein FliG
VLNDKYRVDSEPVRNYHPGINAYCIVDLLLIIKGINMKKILIFICLLSAICVISAIRSENLNTIVELETEQKISERVEKLLFPFVGESVVIIDLDLKYPAFQSYTYKGKNKSYYKDDIQKSKTELLKNKLTNANIDQIQIVNMKVSIYLVKTIKSAKEKFVEQSVTNWLGLDLHKGDELTIYKTLSFTAAGRKSEKTDEISLPYRNINKTIPFSNDENGIFTSFWLIVIIGLILSIILILLNFTLRFGIRSLRDSIGQIKTSKAGNPYQIKPGRASSSALHSSAILEESKKNPLGINILEDKKERIKELPDFNFLENLSNDEFFDLIEKEKLHENELSYILSVLSVNFVNRLLINDSNERTNKLVEIMMNETNLPKDKFIKLRANILKGYKKTIDEQIIKTDGKTSLVKFINNLSNKKAYSVFKRICELNQETATEIRDKIFLFEDIVKLDDPLLKDIIFEIDQELLVDFLVSADETIKNKFISNMTDRTASMINEELQFTGAQTDEEKEITINDTLKIIKTILGYI